MKHKKSRYIFTVFTIFLTSIFLSGCGLFSLYKDIKAEKKFWDSLQSSIDKETSAKDKTSGSLGKGELLAQIILSDIERHSSDNIIKLFSQRVKNEIGETRLRDEIKDIEAKIAGNIIKYETESDGGSGHRGGRGVTTRQYTINVYTDMEIYKISFNYVKEDNTSDDEAVNAANRGFYRIIALPVSLIYSDSGILTECSDDSIYRKFDDKEGAYIVEPELLARDVHYEQKSYTGYSIEYLQDFLFDGAVKKSCEQFMDILDSVGFEGDISAIEGIYENSDGVLKKWYNDGFNVLLTDDAGRQYLAETKYGADDIEYVLRVADTELTPLYQAETLP